MATAVMAHRWGMNSSVWVHAMEVMDLASKALERCNEILKREETAANAAAQQTDQPESKSK